MSRSSLSRSLFHRSAHTHRRADHTLSGVCVCVCAILLCLLVYSSRCHCCTKTRHSPVSSTLVEASGVKPCVSPLEIFVGGLPYHTTDETLRKFFERFGEIEEAVVRDVLEKTGVNRGDVSFRSSPIGRQANHAAMDS